VIGHFAGETWTNGGERFLADHFLVDDSFPELLIVPRFAEPRSTIEAEEFNGLALNY
jgi:hypothetical protein